MSPNMEHQLMYNKSVVYKNKFCAYCNNISSFENFYIQFYPEDINLSEVRSFQDQQGKLEIFLRFGKYVVVPPGGARLRTCLINSISNNKSFCELYSNPVVQTFSYHSVMYRNYFCLSQEQRSSVENLGCLGPFFERIPTYFKLAGLSVMFSFTEQMSGQKPQDKECEIWTKEVRKIYYPNC